jgi:hypothetical protein
MKVLLPLILECDLVNEMLKEIDLVYFYRLKWRSEWNINATGRWSVILLTAVKLTAFITTRIVRRNYCTACKYKF